jgi:hypothetical protein
LKSLRRRPVDGIVPAGWLEKHAAALPSVILIVLQLEQGHEISQKQHQQRTLQETLQNLQYSLAPKRQMKLHVVGLVQRGVSSIATEQWYETMQATLQQQQQPCPIALSLVPIQELQPDVAYRGSALQQLHEVVRTASLEYYRQQTRHVKEKLRLLGPERTLPALLPLSIRYCFQTAVFYEFQWKQDKSLQYLVEAHRLLEAYHRYLLEAGVAGENDYPESASHPPQPGEPPSARISAGGDGVELSLGGSTPPNFAALLQSIRPPQDMMQQCRTVADWIHFKILQSCLVSNSQGSLVAASQQWQRHVQSFCCPRRSFLECDKETGTAWLDWSYVARQHVVLGQLLERYPPRALLSDPSKAASSVDEILLRLSPWKSYQGAAEAYLRLAYCLREFNGRFGKEPESDARTRYVGGIDHEGLEPLFQEESKVNHQEEALKCATRAISLFQKETVSESNPVTTMKRSVARLQYLAGGILLAMSRPLEALPYLEDASEACKGWSGLEFAISRLLVECYGRIDEFPSDRKSPNLASKLLVSYLRAQISEDAFRSALEKIGSLTGEGQDQTILWTVPISDGEDVDSPLAFTVTFPNGSHGTAGDAVSASIWIESKMDFAVQVESLTIMSVAGSIIVPTKDLLMAKNANKASGAGIMIQAHNKIEITTSINLPNNLEALSGSESDAAVDANLATLKRSARPRTAGLTAGAGARFIFREDLVESSSSQRVPKSSWNSECLGGTPIQCTGLEVVLSPVLSQTKIRCILEKQATRSEASVKRTPFEEENYLSSAWERPNRLPVRYGPRVLRILPPLPTMVVTDVTGPLTNGVALEGTVNRVVLQLTAPRSEEYSDIKVQTRCASTLAAEQDADDKEEDILSRDQPDPRSPVLVKVDTSCKAAATSSGYCLPDGWSLVGDGQFEAGGGSDDFATVGSSSLKGGMSTYAFVDLYRPALDVKRAAEKEAVEEQCHTKVRVSICYRQQKSSLSKETADLATDASSDGEDIVSLDYTITLVWKPAVKAVFAAEGDGEANANHVLIGDKTTTRSCIFLAAATGLDINIDQIQFALPVNEDFEPLDTVPNSVVYKNDDGTALGRDSSLSVAWPCRMNGETNLSTARRMLSVSWSPVPLEIPNDVIFGVGSDMGVSIHGPLPLSTPSRCYIPVPSAEREEAPFDVQIDRAPDSLQVGVPFELSYEIANRTSLDQELDIRQDHEGCAILLGGQANSAISLTPFETYSLSFMIIPMKVGQIKIPHLSVWSKRYQTWVVQNTADNHTDCCVLP